MINLTRLLIALTVFISGAALVPVMGLPTQGFNWQRYADAYTPATLESNHASGKPGSFFTIMGGNFTPDAMVTISANGVVLGTVQTSEWGELLFVIETSSADAGYYQIEASETESAATQLFLDPQGTLWTQEDEGIVLSLPANIASQLIFMPVIVK